MYAKFISFLLCIAVAFNAWGQAIERKIIIQDKHFYFQKINEENQLATMFVGKTNAAVSHADSFAVPFGRNFEMPFNPFVWDFYKDNFFSLNFLRHPLNDWNEAVKIIGMQDLKTDSFLQHARPIDLIFKSCDYYAWQMNEPFMEIKRNKTHFDQFYYDGVMSSDSTLWMMYAIDNQYQLWQLHKQEWKQIGSQDLKLENYFSLVNWKNKLLLFYQDNFYVISKKSGKIIGKYHFNGKLDKGILVIDRDKNKLYWLASENLNSELPFEKILKSKAKLISLPK